MRLGRAAERGKAERERDLRQLIHGLRAGLPSPGCHGRRAPLNRSPAHGGVLNAASSAGARRFQ